MTFEDDAGRPSIGTTAASTVDEDDLSTTNAGGADLADGNADSATDDATTVTDGTLDTDGDATTVAGSLDISWGADDGDVADTGGQDTPGGFGNRSVQFASDATTTLDGLGLTSQGVTITYALSASNTVLTASAGGRTVFTVSLSDDGAGSYLFDLVDVLDHGTAGTEDDIPLTFNITATDGDGDTTDGSFQVTVDDDLVVVGSADAATVTEDTTGSAGAETFVTDTADGFAWYLLGRG